MKKQEAFHRWMEDKGYSPAGMMRVIGMGKAALNRARKRNELKSLPHILTVKVGETKPMGRPVELSELQAIYAQAVPHVRKFMLWALGTGARPEAILELQAQQVDFEDGLIHLNPAGRKQTPKKYRPVVRLPDSLTERFEGWAVSYEGKPVKSIKKGLWRACDRAGVPRCSPYSFRHTAARWMRKKGVSPWEVAAQLGHSAGKEYAVTERYAFYSPDYLSEAVRALEELIGKVRDFPNTSQSVEKSGAAEGN